MPLIKRIGFYLLGFSIGVVFLAFFFKEKRAEFCYLPNCRVLKELRSKNIEISPEFKITSTQLNHLLLQGEVLFSKSNVKANPCKSYVIEGKISENKVEVIIEDCPNKTFITSFKEF
ncbi:DUF4258 domain-containing protein [Capnocytophaga canimorsus]|uniref:DUF4258 domain-containing protein n=1 Tax=Capnocytophaga canimorsus TaxID=28188 RepID=UPI0037D1A962